MKTIRNCFLVILATGFFFSCTKYPPGITRLQEDLVVYTQVDLTKDFTRFSTYALADSIAYIDDTDSGRFLNTDAQAILDQITLNMQERGFIRVDKEADPDLGITVSVVKTTSTPVYYPGWWWGYPGYYYPDYWGYTDYWYYYPYYPVYVTSYSSGTLIMDMADFRDITGDKQIPMVWNAMIRALLTGSHTLDEIRLCIDQAFDQSPSIQTTSR